MAGWGDTLFGNLPPPYTAQPSGWWDTLVGNPSRRAAQPSSRGALLGANYQGMPDTRATITDRRQEPPPGIANAMQNASYDPNPPDYWADKYAPSLAGVAPGQPAGVGSDPMLSAAQFVDPSQPSDVAPYTPSFQQNWRSPVPTHAPYRPSPVGPNLPRPGPEYTTSPSDLPYIGSHLPISPGDPGWTPPPSPSGPHNLQGDPARPGYGDIFSSAQNASQFSPQQLTDALRAWAGWQ
jgi:hypothetical protein